MDPQVHQDLLALQVLKGHQDLQDHPDTQAFLVYQDQMLWALLDPLGPQGLKDPLEIKGLLGLETGQVLGRHSQLQFTYMVKTQQYKSKMVEFSMTGPGLPLTRRFSGCTHAVENWRCLWMVPTSSIVR